MSGSQIAPVFQIGPRITAQILGLPYQQYRPNGSYMPCNFGNLVATIPARIGEVKLPGDTRLAWVAIMLPPTGDAQILPGDWIYTDQSTEMYHTVSAVELTPLGWRLSASTAVA